MNKCLSWENIKGYRITEDEYEILLDWGFRLKEPSDIDVYDIDEIIPYTMEKLVNIGGLFNTLSISYDITNDKFETSILPYIDGEWFSCDFLTENLDMVTIGYELVSSSIITISQFSILEEYDFF